MQLRKWIIAAFISLLSWMMIENRAFACLPPAQRFTPAQGAGNSKAALVISSFNSARDPNGARSRTGAEFDTQLYCQVVLDIQATIGAHGVLSVQGMATPYDGDVASPEVDETPPIELQVVGADFLKTVVVPLRHDATSF